MTAIATDRSVAIRSTWSRVGWVAGIALALYVVVSKTRRFSPRHQGMVGARSNRDIRRQVQGLVDSVTSDPAAIQVQVRNGVVTLSGRIAQTEVERLRQDLRHIQGVVEVISHLKTFSRPIDDTSLPLNRGGNMSDLSLTTS